MDFAEQKKQLEDAKKRIHDVTSQIKFAKTQEEKVKLMAELEAASKLVKGIDEFDRETVAVHKQSDAAISGDDEMLYKAGYRPRGAYAHRNPQSYGFMIHKMDSKNPQWNDDIQEMHILNDELLISAVRMLKNHQEGTPIPVDVFKAQQGWRRWLQLTGTSKLRKALDGTTGQGEEWIPTALSRNFLEIVRLELQIASLFFDWPMTSNSWDMPLEGADAIAFKVPQTSNNDIHDKASAATASELATSKVTFTADKMGARVVFNEEVELDSPVNIGAHARDKMAQAMANGIENVTLNGSEKGTHPDNDVEVDAATAKRNERLWPGFRDLIQDAGAGGGAQFFDAAGAIDHDDFRSTRKLMGKYGMQNALSRLVHVISINVNFQMLDRTNFADFQTLDKYGPEALVLTGEVGRLDGIPVIPSEFQREDVAATGFNTVAGPNTKTTIAIVNRDTYNYGTRQDVTIASETNIETDKTVVVTKLRRDAKPVVDTTETYIAGMRNVIIP